MKSLIAALMLVSTTAFAQMTIQPYMPRLNRTVLKLDQVTHEIRSISVDLNGKVTVIPRFNRSIHFFQLSPSNKSEILGNVKYASGFETITRFSEIVCMMMPDPNTARVLTLLDETTGKYRLILSPRGCAYTTVTLPKEEYEIMLAEKIVENLVMLANQSMNH